MTNWTDFQIIYDYFVQHWTGSTIAFSMLLLLAFLIILTTSGLPFQMSLVLSIPVMAGFAVGGWLTNDVWAYHLLLMIAAIIYAITIVKIFRR